MKYFLTFLFLFLSTTSFAQQLQHVDFKTANVDLSIHPEKKYISGKVVYTFDILNPVDSIFINGRDLSYKTLLLNNKEFKYYKEGKKLWILNNFQPSKNNVLRIEYEAFPKKAMYFVGWDNEAPDQVWTQGQGKYTSNWLPSFDDVNEKVEFDLKIQFKKPHKVIANGKFLDLERLDYSDYYVWHYDMKKPMSSYLLAIVIGEYNKKVEYSKSGISLEMYYYPEDSSKVEPTYRYTKQMFDFLEEEIGVSYPWQNYKLVPVHDFLYAGMENTSLTIFSDAFITDETGFVDKNFVNVNAHELAHQWFGDLVTAKSGEHHWLQEGFATYYALLAEKEVFGEDYYYWRLYEYAEELIEQDKAGQSTSLLDPKSSSTTFYKKGAWALHLLRDKVGDKVFKKAVKNYLKRHQYKNVETSDFLSEIEKISALSLKSFVTDWLNNEFFNKEQAYASLRKNENTRAILEIKDLNNISIIQYLSNNGDSMNSEIFYSLLQDLNSKNKDTISLKVIELYKNALKSKDTKKRQAVALNLKEIPLALKKDYESLLNDESYITIEAALFNLWNSFPQDQEVYLEKTKNIVGFSDKNIRTLWLTLAILTDNDSLGDLHEYLEELTNYTSPDYSFEVRQNAFRYLRWIRSCEETCQENIKDASTHHNWRFQQFAKNFIKKYKL